MWLLSLLKWFSMIKSQILTQGFTDQEKCPKFESDQDQINLSYLKVPIERYQTWTKKIKPTSQQVLGAPWIPISVIAAGQMMIIILLAIKKTSGSMTPSKNLTLSCHIHMNIKIAQVIALKKKNTMTNIKKWAKYSIAAHWQCYPLWWSRIWSAPHWSEFKYNFGLSDMLTILRLYAKLSFFPSITSLINSKCLMVL